eukprot:4090058-Alexandrium_andersonii.AAC.1
MVVVWRFSVAVCELAVPRPSRASAPDRLAVALPVAKRYGRFWLCGHPMGRAVHCGSARPQGQRVPLPGLVA